MKSAASAQSPTGNLTGREVGLETCISSDLETIGGPFSAKGQSVVLNPAGFCIRPQRSLGL